MPVEKAENTEGLDTIAGDNKDDLPGPVTAIPHTKPTSTDSLVTVRLSEPVSTAAEEHESTMQSPLLEASNTDSYGADSVHRVEDARSSLETKVESDLDRILEPTTGPADGNVNVNVRESIVSQDTAEFPTFHQGMEDEFAACETSSIDEIRPRSESHGSGHSQNSGIVDWSELEKTEKEEARDDQTDESTAFLLARLEQENNALATDPRFGLRRRSRKESRPPSMQVLKQLVNDPNSRASRYSVLPSPPPMTELEFWAALVKDYRQTAQRLPTLTANKIKSGVPPPLRGVVWMSMVGARDTELSEQFDKLCQETSPYENLIGKDIGRSFPGVEMFRDANGEGQAMLGRVLRCFSLYDEEIGYCQGLGFLVGPLLMQMGDKDAFCVLVKLMENYDLRSCFLPNLSGLHIRIYQFQRLLDQHMPSLAGHLKSLGVEAAYLSQWFLSFFAVTCPLPMLFRIYDVILAEGASETIMRVALSLMRRNEKRIMDSKEFEEVMQLLLSRSLWEPYNCDADDLVNDFMDMTGLVSHEKLKNLEHSFKTSHGGDPGAWFGFIPDATSAASRFLGRLWTATTPVKGTLAPNYPANSRPSSFLKRSPSKQSIAISEKSSDMSSDSTNSVVTTNTDITVTSRDSSGDAISMISKSESMIAPMTPSVSKGDRDLHGQIEDLLMALNDMQRQNTIIAAQLQREKEERLDDHVTFSTLIERLKPSDMGGEQSQAGRPQSLQIQLSSDKAAHDNRRHQTMMDPLMSQKFTLPKELHEAVESAEQRLSTYQIAQQSHSSYIVETKQRLRNSLFRSKDQLQVEIERSARLSRQLDEQEKETTQVRENLRQAQSRLQDERKEREKLDKTIQELRGYTGRSNSKAASIIHGNNPSLPTRAGRPDSQDGRVPILNSPGGLREFRLSRTNFGATTEGGQSSNVSQLNAGASLLPRRTSSLATQSFLSTQDHVPASEDDLLVELVNAKTSEAIARQDLEEVKAKLDALRKMLGVPSPPASSTPLTPANYHRSSPSEPVVNTKAGMRKSSGNEKLNPPQQASAVTPGGIGSLASGFWSWRRSPSTTNTTTAVTPNVPSSTTAARDSPTS